ncbi:MAG: hypothetical protein ABI852_15665, partial [Gemmatimonadaceae bacterium]
ITTPVKIVAERDSTYARAIRLRSAEEYVAERCGVGGQYADSLKDAWVAGRIIGDGRNSVESLEIKISVENPVNVWNAVDEFYTTGTDGLFFICSKKLRPGTPVHVEIRKNKQLLQTLAGQLQGFLTILKIPMKLE